MGRAARFTEMAELWEFGSLRAEQTGRALASCELHASNKKWLFCGSLGDWEEDAPGARCATGTYPQVMHNFREFGSLRA